MTVRWQPPWRRHRDMPLRFWLCARAHDTSSRFWRVLGFEVTVSLEELEVP